MTREEAIKILKSKMDGSVDTSYEWAEAVRMAIEALADRPTESDFISKAKVLETYSELYWFDSDCEVVSKAEVNKIYERLQSLPSAEPLVLTCDGCRHVGTYDTDFPCSGCIRREKDYYEQER